jgi:hypothetical protein
MTRIEELELDISVIKKEIKKASENCYYNEVTILELELKEKQKELEYESSKTH